MYKFHYNQWDEKRFPGYTDSINELYDKSMAFYLKNDSHENQDVDGMKKLKELFEFMESYYATLMKLGYVNHNNFLNILEQLKSIRLLRLMPPFLRKRFNGLTHHNIIMINPTPGNFSGLNKEESFQLATFHELGHIITSANKEDIEYLKEVIYKELDEIKRTYPDGVNYWRQGFELLEEVAVHNAAEAVLYERIGKDRPPVKIYQNDTIYPNGTFASNFSEYREFEELAYTFASCLDFIPHDSKDTMCDVLNNLSKSMFSKSFCINMYLELTKNPEKAEDLIKMLTCMGKIKEAKYASFGLSSNSDTESNATKYYTEFYSLADKYRKKENNKSKQMILGQKIQG